MAQFPDRNGPLVPGDHDLIVRIDARTEALYESFGEMKEAFTSKADAARVTRLEERLDKVDEKQSASEKKLNYILGGLVVLEAALKLVAH